MHGDPTDRAATRRRWTRRAGAAAGATLAIALVVLLVRSLDSPPTPKKPTAQQIQLVRPATPPPPPPKPPEKPPEPPKMKEEVKLDTPRPQEAPKPADAPPPAERLGVDATGSGQGDGFGLAANPGGRDLSAAGPTVGGTGGTGTGAIARAQYASYRDVVTRHITERLNRIAELKSTEGQVAVLVWIDRSGRIERIDLRDATPRQAELINASLMASGPLREPPPGAMPQPVWVLLNLRDLG